MKKFGFPDKMKLKRNSEIRNVFAAGRRAGNAQLLAIAMKNPENRDYSRICVAVSKKHGNAVQRNRVKRLVREAWRLGRAELPSGYDVVLIPRAGKGLHPAELQNSICRLMRNFAKD